MTLTIGDEEADKRTEISRYCMNDEKISSMLQMLKDTKEKNTLHSMERRLKFLSKKKQIYSDVYCPAEIEEEEFEETPKLKVSRNNVLELDNENISEHNTDENKFETFTNTKVNVSYKNSKFLNTTQQDFTFERQRRDSTKSDAIFITHKRVGLNRTMLRGLHKKANSFNIKSNF